MFVYIIDDIFGQTVVSEITRLPDGKASVVSTTDTTCKFEKTIEVYPRLFTKRKDAEEFCVFLRSSGHSNVKITVCTL